MLGQNLVDAPGGFVGHAVQDNAGGSADGFRPFLGDGSAVQNGGAPVCRGFLVLGPGRGDADGPLGVGDLNRQADLLTVLGGKAVKGRPGKGNLHHGGALGPAGPDQNAVQGGVRVAADRRGLGG